MSLLPAEKMCTNSEEMKEMAARICRDYLHGAWRKISPQEIGFKRISGGLSNWLYHVWLPERVIKDQTNQVSTSMKVGCSSNSGSEDNEPSQVLIRIYGQVHGDRALEHLITESVIFTLLSERKLGPKLHGIFPGGRIEQYINARPLQTRELALPHLLTQIARKMSAIHNMDVPISKEPQWLWQTSERWLNTIEKCVGKDKTPNEFSEQILKIKNYDLKSEIVWLKQYLMKLNSPVVFSHNDMQEGNILIHNDVNEDVIDKNDQLVLIDFEYCSYNYRGFDIANHFIEWTYDYTNPDYPYYYELPDNYPTKDQMTMFINEYLSASDFQSHPDDIIAEVKSFSLASHFFWGLWACANAPLSQIPFGYWDYAVSRLDTYFRLKDDLTKIGIKRNLHDTD